MTIKVSKQFVKSTVRIINLLISICFLLIPTGCAGTTEDTDEDSSFMEQYEEDLSKTAEAPVPTDRAAIRILFPGYQPGNWKEVKAEIEKHTRDKLNVSLDFKWKEQYSYISEIKTLKASNQDFDAFIITDSDGYTPSFTKLARDGVLKDITNIFPESAPALYSKYSNEELTYATIENKLYAVPSLYTIAECPSIITDDSMLKKYKIDDITDFEQYEAYLKKIKENEPDAIPGVDIGTFMATLPSIFGYVVADQRNMLVYRWDDPEMRLMAWEKTPEFYDTVNMFINWYEKGYMKPALSRDDYLAAISVLIGGSLAPPSKEVENMSMSNFMGTTMETGPVRICRLFPGKTVQRSSPIGSFSINGSFAFPKESKNTEMVLRFLEWVQLDRKNYDLVVNGIEGTDYVINDGMPELPTGMSSLSSSYMYWDGHWAFRNIEYETSEKKVQPLMEYLNSYSKYPPHGVLYPEYGTLEQATAKMAGNFRDFLVGLSQGRIKSQDQLDEFINEMEEFETAELIAAAQSQLTQN